MALRMQELLERGNRVWVGELRGELERAANGQRS
jgi:hypothetical protein